MEYIEILVKRDYVALLTFFLSLVLFFFNTCKNKSFKLKYLKILCVLPLSEVESEPTQTSDMEFFPENR